MSEDYRVTARRAVEQTLESLSRQYQAELMKMATTSGAEQVRAEQEADRIDKLMSKLQEKIERDKLAPVDPTRHDDRGPEPSAVHDQLRQHLHHIDYRHVERVVRSLLESDQTGGRAGLLLFQRSGRMNGRRCAERIGNILKSEGGELFRHFPVGLRPGDRNGVGSLLHHLAGHLNLSIDARPLAEQLTLVSERLCGALQAGSIALVEVGGCDWLTYDDPAALGWLMTDFWPRLLADLEAVARQLHGSVTVLVLLFFDDEVPVGALSSAYCCSIEAPCRERLLEVELKPWQRREILEWLMRWGMPGHPAEDVERIADIVLRVSENMPSLMENQLLKLCAQPYPAH